MVNWAGLAGIAACVAGLLAGKFMRDGHLYTIFAYLVVSLPRESVAIYTQGDFTVDLIFPCRTQQLSQSHHTTLIRYLDLAVWRWESHPLIAVQM